MNNNTINKFKEENQQNSVYFIKYISSNLESNIVYGGIYTHRNGVYINIFSNLIFDHDEYKIIESIKLDDFIGILIKYIVKYFSNDVPTYQYYIPKEKEVKNNNEYNDISDKLKNVKDFNCTYFEKEDKDAMVTEALNDYGLYKDINPYYNSYNKKSNNLKELLSKIEDPFAIDHDIPIDKIIKNIVDINASIDELKHNFKSKSINADDKLDSILRGLYYYKINNSNDSNKPSKDLRDTFEEPTEKDGFGSLFGDPNTLFYDPDNKYMKGYASSFDPDKFGRKYNGIPYKLYFPVVDEHYIDLNNDDVEYGMSSNHKDWKYMIGICRELKTYIITATGGEETRAYAFVDKNYHILQKAELNEVCDMKEVIAPKGSVYLIVNSKNGPLNIVKK